jgi:Protein of unknown function (DUF2452)
VISLSNITAIPGGASALQETHKNPNPQGKGLVPLLRDWQSMQPALCGQKSAADFLRDYCVSALVLGAQFRFKPVVGVTYFLYSAEHDWNLSLVGPQEWGQRVPGEFLATCRLRPDMTWEMEAATVVEHSPALERAQRFICSFVETLSAQESIAEHLPFYARELPYYQRLLATALSSSLQRSMPPSGDNMKALLAAQAGPFSIEWAGAR